MIKRYKHPHTKQLEFYVNYHGCWMCCSHFHKVNGYSTFKCDKKWTRIHRYMYEKYYGEIPRGICVLHHCDNRGCCNPAHLFLGTNSDNNKDRDNKGRQAKGIRNGMALLNARQVKKIYFARGTQLALAKIYGVSRQTIGAIKRKENWRHLWTSSIT